MSKLNLIQGYVYKHKVLYCVLFSCDCLTVQIPLQKDNELQVGITYVTLAKKIKNIIMNNAYMIMLHRVYIYNLKCVTFAPKMYL